MFRFMYRLFIVLVVAALLLAPHPVQAALGSTFNVTSTADLPDDDVGDGVCHASNGACTLRAAVMQANFSAGADTIKLPAGVFLLTRPGDEDGAILGDLDITDSLTIQGAGSASTIVDGNGAVTGDRVFQVFSTVKSVNFSGLTVRNGKRSGVFDAGGGLSWEGGGTSQLVLSDVVFEGNSARYGGGLSLAYGSGGSVELDNVVLRSNTAGAAGAGLSVTFSTTRSAFSMQGGKVYNNTGANQGGGLELEGTQDGVSVERIQNVEIYGNQANFGAGIDNYGGARPYHIDLLDSSVHDNQAVSQGGGINNFAVISVTRTTLAANAGGTYGGGLFNQNSSSVSQVQAFFDRSTISGNSAQYGGGIYSDSVNQTGALTTLTNSTLSGNTASRDGAGAYAKNGQVAFYNATVAANKVVIPTGDAYLGSGAGIYSLSAAYIPLQNTLIADNTHRYGAAAPVADDCNGLLSSAGYNLIESLANCTLFGVAPGNITGQDPLLGPLQNNIGTTQVQAPMRGSPAIDAGQTPACLDANGAALTVDQRGVVRPLNGRCDIGAVEHLPFDVFLPAVQK